MNRIDYKPLCNNCITHIALSIYLPHTFFGAGMYAAFIGGCGVGRRKTLAAARKLLVSKAKDTLERYIEESENLAKVYKAELNAFDIAGLKRLQPLRKTNAKRYQRSKTS